MASKYRPIAGYKIDYIATELVKGIDAKMANIKKQMAEAADKVFIKKVPKDLLEVWKKYPEVFHTCGDLCFYIDGKKDWESREYADLNLPNVDLDRAATLEANPGLVTILNKLAKKRRALKLERAQTVNQIKCTLSKLRSYNKIKVNFPEAYKILTEDIDKEPEAATQESNLCDDVEKLRAKLNKKED